MNKSVKMLFYACILLTACTQLSSCKKEKTYNLPPQVFNIMTKAQLDKLVSMGLPINEGTTPPNIDSVYLNNTLKCTYDGSGGGNVGRFYLSMKIRFANFNTTDNTVKMSYKQGSESASGVGSIVSGKGNDFTVFTKNTGVLSGINFTSVTVFSGTKTASGITNFKYSLLILTKDTDPTNIVIGANEGRTFIENDGDSPFTTW